MSDGAFTTPVVSFLFISNVCFTACRRSSLLPGEWRQLWDQSDCAKPDWECSLQVQSSGSNHTGLWSREGGHHHHWISGWRWDEFQSNCRLSPTHCVVNMNSGFQDNELHVTTSLSSTGALSQFSSQSLTKREVFQQPTEVSTRTNISHTMHDDPYFSGTDNSFTVSLVLPWIGLIEAELFPNRDDDDNTAHRDQRHGNTSDHQRSGSEGRHGRINCHKDVVWILRFVEESMKGERFLCHVCYKLCLKDMLFFNVAITVNITSCFHLFLI